MSASGFTRTTFVLLACLVTPVLAYAHHSFVAIYQMDRRIELTGIVESVSWANPHGRIAFNVEDDAGNVVRWEAETSAVSVLRNAGMPTENLIQTGDVITVSGRPARDGSPLLLSGNILLPNGYEFTRGEPRFEAGRSGRIIAPVEIDDRLVRAATEAADGIFRVWSTNMGDRNAFPMFKGDYPLTAAAEVVRSEFDPLNNELLTCDSKGMPLIMITPVPIEFVQEGENIRLQFEEDNAERLIYMSSVPPADGATKMGLSRGRFEGRTLVVETDLIESGYFSPEGVRHTEQIHIVERFIPNGDYTQLDYVMTVSDPATFTEEFDLTRYFTWRPGATVQPYGCVERY